MRLKRYLLHINPLLSNPEAARRLLRLFAIVLSIGILSGVYNVLLFSFNSDISQRRGYMSSAIAEAHAFFTNREALLESLSLSAVRKDQQAKPLVYLPSSEEIHLQVGSSSKKLWSIWLTQRMRNYMQDKQVSLLYVGTGDQAQVRRLFNSTAQVPELSVAMLEQLHALKNRSAAPLSELWLTDHSEQRSHLYIFIRLDERALESGWLGLEMDTREVSKALSDQSAGEFMMLNADGIQVFSNNPQDSLSQILLSPQGENFFGFIGNGLLPDHLVIRKHLKSESPLVS